MPRHPLSPGGCDDEGSLRGTGRPRSRGRRESEDPAWTLEPAPTYDGETVFWWGIALLAWHNAPMTPGLLGPVVITLFLLTRSGIGPLESQLSKTKQPYVDYIAGTSAFLPRPPGK